MLFIDITGNPDAILDQRAVDNEVYAAALNEMVQLGLDIARIIHKQIVAQSIDSPHTPIDERAPLAFERVSRAVRRSIMLAQRLNETSPRPEPADAPAKSSPSTQYASRQAEEIIDGNVEASTDDDADPAPSRTSNRDAERPCADRLDTPDWEDRLENGPIHEVIDELRNDLGLPPLNPSFRQHERHTDPRTEPQPPGTHLERFPLESGPPAGSPVRSSWDEPPNPASGAGLKAHDPPYSTA